MCKQQALSCDHNAQAIQLTQLKSDHATPQLPLHFIGLLAGRSWWDP